MWMQPADEVAGIQVTDTSIGECTGVLNDNKVLNLAKYMVVLVKDRLHLGPPWAHVLYKNPTPYESARIPLSSMA